MAALTLQAFNDMVKSPSSDNSSFNPENFLIDSGSDISLCWNQHLFTCMKLCDLEQCTPGNSTPLSVQAKAGTYRYGNTYRHKNLRCINGTLGTSWHIPKAPKTIHQLHPNTRRSNTIIEPTLSLDPDIIDLFTSGLFRRGGHGKRRFQQGR